MMRRRQTPNNDIGATPERTLARNWNVFKFSAAERSYYRFKSDVHSFFSPI